MRPSQGTLARLRPVAAPLLLALFVAGAEVVPAVHMTAHRNDHTHGPDHAPRGRAAAAIDAHADHDGGDHDHGGTHGGWAWLAAIVGGHHHDDEDAEFARRDADHEPDHEHDRQPADDHGDGSSAHFLLALVDGPPPLFLPPPPETQAAPPDAAIRTAVPAPLPQPPARGPPPVA